jgi:uncharacterized protein (DUF433 family)
MLWASFSQSSPIVRTYYSLNCIEKYFIMLYGQVSIDPEIMSGAPVFAGTRVPIQNLFDYLESGEDLSEFLDDFPSVTKEAALAVLKMAKQSLTTEKMLHENFA